MGNPNVSGRNIDIPDSGYQNMNKKQPKKENDKYTILPQYSWLIISCIVGSKRTIQEIKLPILNLKLMKDIKQK